MDIPSTEAALFACWPADTTLSVGGWVLRSGANGYNRTNSVWPLGFDGTMVLDDAIVAAEQFYFGRGLSCRFQVLDTAEPSGLDAALDRRGYVRETPCLTMAKSLSGIVGTDHDADLSATPSTAWFDIYLSEQNEARSHECRGILARLPPSRVFAVARRDGEAAGVGLGIRSGDDVAVECVVTRKDARRTGVAHSVMGAIEAWALRTGAKRLLLVVVSANAPAVSLYNRLGFQTLSGYAYRTKQGEANSRS